MIASNLKLGHDDRPKLRVWDVTSGRCLAELPININRSGDEALTADFSPSGNRLVTVVYGRNDNRESELHWFLRVTGWDLRTGKQLGEFTHACSFTDSLSVAAGDESGAVLAFCGQIWGADFERGQLGFKIDRIGPQQRVTPLKGFCQPAFSPDGKRMAVGVEDDPPGVYGIRIYDWPRGKALHTFAGHAGPVTALAFSPDGKKLASGSQDTTVLLWDLAFLEK